MSYMYKRHGTWRCMVYRNGIRKDVPLGPDFAKAKIIKASLEQACQHEKFKKNLVDTLIELGLIEQTTRVQPKENIVTWALARQNLIEHLGKIGRAKKTIYIYGSVLTSIEKILKPEKPEDVTTQKADHWIEALLDMPNPKDKSGKAKMSKGAVNAMVRTAKASFRKFVRWQYIERNPFDCCEIPKVNFSYPRPLTDEELKGLLEVCNKPLRRCIEILVYSGMRPDEFYHLKWKNVVPGNPPYIHIAEHDGWKPKANTERMIPASKELLKALGEPGLPEEVVAGYNDLGYTVNNNWFERSFARALKRVNFRGKKITIYSCRDTYATNLALQGHEAHVIAARLGHRNLNTSMRYVSLARLNKAI